MAKIFLFFILAALILVKAEALDPFPTVVSTEAPTTAQPTTAEPSLTYTEEPSSLQPTETPSSLLPTEAPSSLIPSADPSFASTEFPTRGESSQIKFTVSQTIVGLTAADYNLDVKYEKALKRAIAKSITSPPINETNVHNLTVSAGARRKLHSVQLQSNSIVATYTVSLSSPFPPQAYGSQIANAVSNSGAGGFANILQQSAQQVFGTTSAFSTVTAGPLVLGTPSATPTTEPTTSPTATPSSIIPSATPSSEIPTAVPTYEPTAVPTYKPTPQPTSQPSRQPSSVPSKQPSSNPSNEPSNQPSTQPSSQPSQVPTSAPSFKAEFWGEVVTDIRRRRTGGLCENHCSHHGTCEMNSNCNCYIGLDGEPEWTGPDCSLRTCPKDFAWVGSVVGANDLHPWVECSNKGICDRTSGFCNCFTGYEGVACQRTICPEDCNGRGTCWPERILAAYAGREYSTPWDAMKQVGCYCDPGYRGAACELQECPSGTDPLNGYGNEAGRDCSGRGICNYNSGTCDCFSGFFGTKCQHQNILF